MKSITVLGIGNRLMEDDGIGVYIVEKLKEEDNYRNVEYIIGETDTDYCISEISDTDYIILIDASDVGKKPGDITVLPIKETVRYIAPDFFSHSFNMFSIINAANNSINGLFIGIQPYRIDYNFGLSPVIEAVLPNITDSIRKIIKKHITSYP